MAKDKIISSCLAGISCRYDGNHCKRKNFSLNDPSALFVCPEELGGLETPRDPAEIQNDQTIRTNKGRDVTANYYNGAKLALEQAIQSGAKKAFLKSKSPMCGCGKIYDGSFSGRLIEGDGVFAKMLKENGIEIITVE